MLQSCGERIRSALRSECKSVSEPARTACEARLAGSRFARQLRITTQTPYPPVNNKQAWLRIILHAQTRLFTYPRTHFARSSKYEPVITLSHAHLLPRGSTSAIVTTFGAEVIVYHYIYICVYIYIINYSFCSCPFCFEIQSNIVINASLQSVFNLF